MLNNFQVSFCIFYELEKCRLLTTDYLYHIVIFLRIIIIENIFVLIKYDFIYCDNFSLVIERIVYFIINNNVFNSKII